MLEFRPSFTLWVIRAERGLPPSPRKGYRNTSQSPRAPSWRCPCLRDKICLFPCHSGLHKANGEGMKYQLTEGTEQPSSANCLNSAKRYRHGDVLLAMG